MTDQHPLTDDIIEDILLNRYWWELEPCQDALRDAADWQLEQVIKWLEETECNQYNHVKIIHANDLRRAMRPQQQENQ